MAAIQRVGVHLAHGKQPPFFSFQGIAPDSRHVIEYLWHDGGCDVEL
jgi:hypothetical protein